MNIEIQSEECVLKCGIPNVGASIQSQPGNRYALIISFQAEGNAQPITLVVGKKLVIPLGTFLRFKNLQEIIDWHEGRGAVLSFAEKIEADDVKELYQRWANIITAMQLTFGVEKFQEEFDNVTLEELLAYSKGL